MEKNQNQKTRECKNCAHHIFNEQWGEHRCKKFASTIYDKYRADYCQYYEEAKK